MHLQSLSLTLEWQGRRSMSCSRKCARSRASTMQLWRRARHSKVNRPFALTVFMCCRSIQQVSRLALCSNTTASRCKSYKL